MTSTSTPVKFSPKVGSIFSRKPEEDSMRPFINIVFEPGYGGNAECPITMSDSFA
jgi:hypothetical protein